MCYCCLALCFQDREYSLQLRLPPTHDHTSVFYLSIPSAGTTCIHYYTWPFVCVTVLMLFNLKIIYQFMCMGVLCVYMCMQNPKRPEEGVILDLLELKLQVTVSCYVGSGNQTWDLQKSNKCLTLSSLFVLVVVVVVWRGWREEFTLQPRLASSSRSRLKYQNCRYTRICRYLSPCLAQFSYFQTALLKQDIVALYPQHSGGWGDRTARSIR